MRRFAMALMSGLTLVLAIVADGSSVAAPDRPLLSADGSTDTCLVEIMGDVNVSSAVTSADVIYVVRWTFLQGPRPKPCQGAADVNCSGQVSGSDIIIMVNFIFKSGPEFCNICTSAQSSLGCVE